MVAGLRHGWKRLPHVVSNLVAGWRQLHEGGWFSRKGCRYLWVAFHNDQRLSWVGHFLICWGSSWFLGLLVEWVVRYFGGAGLGFEWFVRINAGVASLDLLIFFLREIGDERKWRKLGMWDVLDVDTSVQGKTRLGVSRRYDKIGDLLGPFFNWCCAMTFMGADVFGGF